MAETLLNIPTTLLPSATEGEVFIGRFEVKSIEDDVAHVLLSSADTLTSKDFSAPKKSASWADRIAGKGSGEDLKQKARNDERLAQILSKHAPGYLD